MLSLRISFLFAIYKVCYIACKLFLKKYCVIMVGTLPNFHEFHIFIAAGIVESCKIMMNLFFSVRTDVPNFGPTVQFLLLREACSMT